MKRFLITLLACGAFVRGAHAYTVSFDLEANRLRSINSTTDFPTTGLILLVASTTNTTFGTTISAGTGLAIGNFLDQGDDQILARFDLSLSATPGVAFSNPTVNTNSTTFPNLDSGDRLALYWFPSLTLSSTAIPNTATSYGTYQSGNTNPTDGSAAWAVPNAAAANYKLYFITSDSNTTYNAAGSHTALEATAGLFTTPIPEPSSLVIAALALVGLGGMFLRRRECLA